MGNPFSDPGKLKDQVDGIHFKSSKTNKVMYVKRTTFKVGS